MDIHINLPEQLIKEAREISSKLGLTIDELFANALMVYLNTHREDITETLNEIYDKEASMLDPSIDAMQTLSLSVEQW